ncbi:MAG: hypothetical protein PUJ24_08530, partial [Bacteroidales bacterium]|nr:hypothetical protein [Bacteroidales bacterium]
MKNIIRHTIATILIITALITPATAQQKARKTAEPVAGERIGQLLERNGIDTKNQKLFIALNWQILTKDDGLMMGYKYSLPNADDIANADAIIKKATEARQAAAKSKEQTTPPPPAPPPAPPPQG